MGETLKSEPKTTRGTARPPKPQPPRFRIPHPKRPNTRYQTPRGGSGEDGDNDTDGLAFEALRSVKKLAEVKRVFDRFAVDGMLTANEALQALTEAGCTAPRTHAGRYLRSRRFFGLRREVHRAGTLTRACACPGRAAVLFFPSLCFVSVVLVNVAQLSFLSVESLSVHPAQGKRLTFAPR